MTEWIIRFLGTGQDAGVPQIFCSCINCMRAIKEPEKYQRYAASLALINVKLKFYILFDASPDVKHQIIKLQKKYPQYELLAVLITHGHYGHIGGLHQFGKECSNRPIIIVASEKMAEYFSNTPPYSLIMDLENMEYSCPLRGMSFYKDFRLPTCTTEDVSVVKLLPIKHRSEFGDTAGLLFETNGKKILYIPDTDELDQEYFVKASNELKKGDILIVDGTFFSEEELKHRDIKEIPHPLVNSSIVDLGEFMIKGIRIIFTHFNHTNPLNNPDTEEYSLVINSGFEVSYDNMEIFL